MSARTADKLGIGILTCKRLPLLKQTLVDLEAAAPGILAHAYVVAHVNGSDPETEQYLRSLKFVNRIVSTAGPVQSIGHGVAKLTSVVFAESRVQYYLHLEDDWSAIKSKDPWLDRACNILDRDPSIGAVRLRAASERVLPYHVVTGQPINWAANKGFRRAPSAHFTFNPTLTSVRHAKQIYAGSTGEGDAQRRYLKMKLATAQLVPGVFKHIGSRNSLRNNGRPFYTSVHARPIAPDSRSAVVYKSPAVASTPKSPTSPVGTSVPKNGTAKRKLRASVIVPCIARHLEHVPTLLKRIAAQSRKPEQLVISISECAGVPRQLQILFAQQPFEVVVKTNPNVAFAGANRNAAGDASNGDVLIYQDADDLPHPQRIETIMWAFESQPIDHLMHQYAHEDHPSHASVRTQWKGVFTKDTTLSALQKQPSYGMGGLHNGQIATTRSLFSKLRWSPTLRRGQDVDYNKKSYRVTKQTYVLKLPLIWYQQRLTSAPETIGK